MRVSVPGEAKHASFHAKGVDKGGCLLSPFLLALRVQPSRPHTRVRPCVARVYIYIYMRGIRWYRMLLEFLSCLPPRNKQFAQISREIIVAGLFPIPRREGIRNCRGSYCSLFVNFIRLFSLRFYTFFFFNFSRCFLDFSDLILMYIYIYICENENAWSRNWFMR